MLPTVEYIFRSLPADDHGAVLREDFARALRGADGVAGFFGPPVAAGTAGPRLLSSDDPETRAMFDRILAELPDIVPWEDR